MFKRTPITPSTTSPDITSDLALTCTGYCPKGGLQKNIEQRTHEGNCDAAGGAGKNGPGEVDVLIHLKICQMAHLL